MVKATVTFERVGLRIIAESARYGRTVEYEAKPQTDGSYTLFAYHDGAAEVVASRADERLVKHSLDEIVESMAEMAGNRI